MRLSEEIISLLQNLGSNSSASSFRNADPPEALSEAVAECAQAGLIERDHQTFRLTQAGNELLSRIHSQLSSADRIAAGETGRIAFLSQRDYPRFQKLTALGLSPGVPIRVQQRFPSFVILCEETEIALEEEIAKDIFVWRSR
jgi:Fe2+ transport system protein FeoA